jgi:lipopolysaccharide/colanic/teichoic acid biosynthesis glycosyltransferase
MHQDLYRPVKRILDRIVAAMFLIVSLPVWVVAISAVVLDARLCFGDRGPVFYRERRISRGREFDLLKLRTLRRDALATQAAGEAHARALEADPANLTWAGRHVLKPWYLDELPQLLHVLRGELSLVGPRPWPPSMVREQIARGLDYRNHVLAGWTGPAQISKDAPEPFTDAKLDLEYVEALRTWSSLRLLRHDLAVLVATAKVLARGEGLRY